jgi:deoxyribodipyrimidine photo-lyase
MTRDWKDFDHSVAPVEAWQGGTRAGLKRLKFFTEKLLANYAKQRNHPEIDGTSCMSPYLHFGHIGHATIALAVDAAAKANTYLQSSRDSYFNELITWRELAINFVRTTPNYDSPDCAEPWAKQTIAQHAATNASASTRCINWKLRKPTTTCGTPPDPDGAPWLDAQLPAHVMGQEDSRVDA